MIDMRTSCPSRSSRTRCGLLLLFAPAALFAVLGANALYNGFSQPVLRAGDSPEGEREAVIFLKRSAAYPFAGEVQAYIEVRSLPGHSPLHLRSLGSHRWASEAEEAYREIEWGGPTSITVRSADGTRSRVVHFPPHSSQERQKTTFTSGERVGGHAG